MLKFFNKENKKVINVNDIDDLIGKIELIDIREPYEYQGGSIKSARNIPMGDLLSNPSKYLTKDKAYYIMCQSGARSNMASKQLAKQGYDITNVSGGMGTYVGIKRK